MDTQRRDDAIAGTLAREGDATYLVVAIDIGVAHQAHHILIRQLCGG